jgi:hypothetical protein
MEEIKKTTMVRVLVHAVSAGPEPFFQIYGEYLQRAAPDRSSQLHNRLRTLVVRRDLIQPLWDRGWEGCTFLRDVPNGCNFPTYDADEK